MRRGSHWLVALLGALVLAASPALADQRECEAAQLKTIGKYSKKLYKCLSKATARETGAARCIARAEHRFEKQLSKAVRRGCDVTNDFDALAAGLIAAIGESADEIQLNFKSGQVSIEPCQTDFADVYEVALLAGDELRARVDTIDDAFYFDPSLALAGVSNLECVSEDRPKARLAEFEFGCSFDPQLMSDPAHPDGFCPELTLIAGPSQNCSLTVAVEGSCEDPDAERGDYRLDVFINGNPSPVTRVGSNVDLSP